MDKVFAVAGVSTLDGVAKARFAKDLGRVKVLEKNGHTDVRLIELPKAMDKDAAVAFLAAHADFQDAAAQAALKGEGKAAPASKVKAPKVAKVTKVKEVKLAAKTDKTPAEVAAIKAKNLETLRKVGRSWQEIRNTDGERMLAEAEERIDALTEAGIPDYRWARIDD
jgi:3-dehydroquinate synthase class II